jgi:hypothetical protein
LNFHGVGATYPAEDNMLRHAAAIIAGCALIGQAHATDDFNINQMAAIKLLAMADNASVLCAFPMPQVDTFLAKYGLTNDQLGEQIETKIGGQMFEAEKADPNFCSQFADLLKVNPNARMLFDR